MRFPNDRLYEVGLWADMLHLEGTELSCAYRVDIRAIVVPETIDAIRALTVNRMPAGESIALADAALEAGTPFAARGSRLST